MNVIFYVLYPSLKYSTIIIIVFIKFRNTIVFYLNNQLITYSTLKNIHYINMRYYIIIRIVINFTRFHKLFLI